MKTFGDDYWKVAAEVVAWLLAYRRQEGECSAVGDGFMVTVKITPREKDKPKTTKLHRTYGDVAVCTDCFRPVGVKHAEHCRWTGEVFPEVFAEQTAQRPNSRPTRDTAMRAGFQEAYGGASPEARPNCPGEVTLGHSGPEGPRAAEPPAGAVGANGPAGPSVSDPVSKPSGRVSRSCVVCGASNVPLGETRFGPGGHNRGCGSVLVNGVVAIWTCTNCDFMAERDLRRTPVDPPFCPHCINRRCIPAESRAP